MATFFDTCLVKWAIITHAKYQNIELFIFWNFKSGQILLHSKVLLGFLIGIPLVAFSISYLMHILTKDL
jgi:hypothetical protein